MAQMTQVQRILSRLDEAEGYRTFAELFDFLGDVPKGSLSAQLANLYKDGHVERRVRDVENGRDLKEYQISDEGKAFLTQSLEEGPKRAPRKARKRKARTTKETVATLNNVQAVPAMTTDFSQVEKLASRKQEYAQFHSFMNFLEVEGVVKKNVGELDNYVLQFLGVDPEKLKEQREAMDNLMSMMND